MAYRTQRPDKDPLSDGHIRSSSRVRKLSEPRRTLTEDAYLLVKDILVFTTFKTVTNIHKNWRF